MFGTPNTFDASDTSLLGQLLPPPYNDVSITGDQVRGFGFLHDGSIDTVFRFHGATVFAQTATNPSGIRIVVDPTDPVKAPEELAANLTLRRELEAFVLAFDSNLAPIVGQQVTLRDDSGADAAARVALLEARAASGECDLVVRAQLFRRSVGFLYRPATASFTQDRSAEPPVTDTLLRGLARHAPLTFTAVPPGSGMRIGLDRDLDGVLDGDE
jgi:hypothetical protein